MPGCGRGLRGYPAPLPPAYAAGWDCYLSSRMRVKVNGQDAQLEAGTSLESLVSAYRLKPEQIVIELNRKVPAKALWATTLLAEGDEVEIVKFLGGG